MRQRSNLSPPVKKHLIKTLKQVNPLLRTVFVLRDIEGLSIDQTAVVLGLSHTAVKARLWRARLRLREGLSKYFARQTESAPAESSGFYQVVTQAASHSHGLLTRSGRS